MFAEKSPAFRGEVQRAPAILAKMLWRGRWRHGQTKDALRYVLLALCRFGRCALLALRLRRWCNCPLMTYLITRVDALDVELVLLHRNLALLVVDLVVLQCHALLGRPDDQGLAVDILRASRVAIVFVAIERLRRSGG